MRTQNKQDVSPIPIDDADTASVWADVLVRGAISQHWCEDRNQTVFRLTDVGKETARELLTDIKLEWNRHDADNDTTSTPPGNDTQTEEAGGTR